MYAIRLIVNLTIMIVVVAVVSKSRPEKAGITFLLYVAGQFFTCVCCRTDEKYSTTTLF